MMENEEGENEDSKREGEKNSWNPINDVSLIFVEMEWPPFERLRCQGSHPLDDSWCNFALFVSFVTTLTFLIAVGRSSFGHPTPSDFHTSFIIIVGVHGARVDKIAGHNVSLCLRKICQVIEYHVLP